MPNNSHPRHCACAISQSLVRRCLFISGVRVSVGFNNNSHFSRKSRTASYLAMRYIWHDTVCNVPQTPDLMCLLFQGGVISSGPWGVDALRARYFNYPSPKYYDERVGMSVCLSARISQKPHGRLLTVAVARSSSTIKAKYSACVAHRRRSLISTIVSVFLVAAAPGWNALPQHVKSASTLPVFNASLQT